MITYFRNYSGGIKDVAETFGIFSQAMEKFVIPAIPLPELERIRSIFGDDPSSFTGEVRRMLFESEDADAMQKTEQELRRLKDDLGNLAEERGILLVLGRNGVDEAQDSNAGQDPLEYKVLNILYVCVEKLAALLAYKRAQIKLSQRDTR